MARRDSIGKEALERMARHWQPILGLQNWTIRVELVEFTRESQSGDVKVDDVSKTALVLMTKRPFRNEEQVLLHELLHVVLWPLDRTAMDLAEVAPKGGREHELGTTMVFRALEPVTEQLTAALLMAAGKEIEPAWWALEREAAERMAEPK
jgi:hypothetical protein